MTKNCFRDKVDEKKLHETLFPAVVILRGSHHHISLRFEFELLQNLNLGFERSPNTKTPRELMPHDTKQLLMTQSVLFFRQRLVSIKSFSLLTMLFELLLEDFCSALQRKLSMLTNLYCLNRL